MLEDSRIRENLSLVFLLCMATIFFIALYLLFGREIMFDVLLLAVYIASFSLLGTVLIYAIYANPPASKLLNEKKQLKEELSNLEQKFLKRQISEENFIKLLSKKQRRLIKVEAKIHMKTSPRKLSGIKARLLKRRERSALKRLMQEKYHLLTERRIAATKLYKRQITREDFQKFIEENDNDLVKIESLMNILFARILEPREEEKRKRIIREIVEEEKIDTDRMAKELAEQQK